MGIVIQFEKYQGTGNDFIIINGLESKVCDEPDLAIKVCQRHFGVGADGLIIVKASDIADIRMVYYNADGSEAPMCGNGLRCFAKYVYDHKIIQKNAFRVETLGGMMEVELVDGLVKLNMGLPEFDTRRFPIQVSKSLFVQEKIYIDQKPYNISALNLGTIHTVLFVDDLDLVDIKVIGEKISNHEIFPKKTNVNFCQVIGENHLKVITYERGVGITQSCGTGCCATSVIATLLGYSKKKVSIQVLGGRLEVEEKDGNIFLIGPADLICCGKDQYNSN